MSFSGFAKLLGVAAVALSASAASAATIDWADWSNTSPVTATVGTNTATYTGDGVWYLGGSGVSPGSSGLDPVTWGPTSTYVGGPVGNAPPVSGNIIQLVGGNSDINTVAFTTPVTDPVMAIWSLGSNGTPASFMFNLAEAFQIVAGGPSDEGIVNNWGNNSAIITCNLVTVCGAEGNGTIEFLGTFSSISWTNPQYENWYGFTVGVAAAPLPSTWTMLLIGFAGLGFFAYRGTKDRSAAAAA